MNNKKERKLIVETGFNITDETLDFIKQVEKKAYPKEMILMNEVDSVIDLAETYETYPSSITIARNIDWYIIFDDNKANIEIIDIASLPNRDKEKSRTEIHDYIVNVINKKANEDKKPVLISAKEDTSYKMIQRMVNNHEYEVITDISDTWDIESAITMHDLVLKPIIQETKHIKSK